MQADQARVAFLTAGSCATSLAMSLARVMMPASAPSWVAVAKSCVIVPHLLAAACSAAGTLGELAGSCPPRPRAVSAVPGGTRKPYCCASAAPRYTPSAPGLVESQARGSAEGDVERDDAIAEGDARVAGCAHARLGEGVLRCAGRQAVVVGYPERGVGGERLARQRRLGGGRCWRPAHGGRRDGRVGSLGRGGGAGGEGRAAAGQQADAGADVHVVAPFRWAVSHA